MSEVEKVPSVMRNQKVFPRAGERSCQLKRSTIDSLVSMPLDSVTELVDLSARSGARGPAVTESSTFLCPCTFSDPAGRIVAAGSLAFAARCCPAPALGAAASPGNAALPEDPLVDDDEDVPPACYVRYLILPPLRLAARILLWVFGFWWISANKLPALPSRNRQCLITPNHQSLLDPVFLFYWVGPMSVSKAGVKNIPILGGLAKAVRTIFVDRQDKDSRARTLKCIRSRAADPRFPPLCIYPEGTVTNGRSVIRFASGHSHPDCQCNQLRCGIRHHI